MAHDVFISHSVKDKAIADAVCATLEGRCIRCWIAPRDILPGQDWDTAIIAAIKASKVMLLLFTTHSNDSNQVHREVKAAFSRGVTVIPLRLDDATLNDNLEFYMGHVHWIDAMTPPIQRHLFYAAETVEIVLGVPKSQTQNERRQPDGAAAESRGSPGSRDDLTSRDWRVAQPVSPSPRSARITEDPVFFAQDRSCKTKDPRATPRALVARAKELVNSIRMTFKLIPAGEFMMGSPDSEVGRRSDEEQHQVRLTRAFYLGAHQVTQEEYETLMGNNPSFFAKRGGGAGRLRSHDTRRLPVEQVTWHDARRFCEKLSELSEERSARRQYRLPTEAEWEYACRARSLERFSGGNELDARNANCNFSGFHKTAAVKGFYLDQTTCVGSYAPNPFGIFDMHGNVSEWCADWYYERYYANSPSDDPIGPFDGVTRVVRGGSWWNALIDARSAARSGMAPSRHNSSIGFRVVCVLE